MMLPESRSTPHRKTYAPYESLYGEIRRRFWKLIDEGGTASVGKMTGPAALASDRP